jgi:nucleoside-diphosphate-sugar epimerase
MNIFLTGATGFIGSAIARELLAAGHRVIGLARNDAARARLMEVGLEAHPGSLTDLDSLRGGAAAADGVIHTAFIHDFSSYPEAAEADRRAVEAIAQVLAGTAKAFVATSVTALLPPGHLATEEDTPDPRTHAAFRLPAERAVLAAAERGVRTSVVRLPPAVHGPGDHAFVPALIEIARRTGTSAYLEDGENRWPAVHRLDAARLFRLALEHAPAGSVLHAVADEGVALSSIAEVIARKLGLAGTTSIARANAQEHFGWLAAFMGIDNPTSSTRTRAAMNWQPQEPGLLAELESAIYFPQPMGCAQSPLSP